MMQQHGEGIRFFQGSSSSELLLIPKRGLEELNNGATRKKQRGPSQPQIPPVCQVEGCNTDLRDSKGYHRRHRVCEVHSKTARSLVDGIEQRFCQQCSRFHILEEFDDGKRSCRKRLAGHNERRRKPAVGSPESIFASAMFNPGDFKHHPPQEQQQHHHLLNGSFISSWPESQGALSGKPSEQHQQHPELIIPQIYRRPAILISPHQERMLYEFVKSQMDPSPSTSCSEPPGEAGAALSLLSAGQSATLLASHTSLVSPSSNTVNLLLPAPRVLESGSSDVNNSTSSSTTGNASANTLPSSWTVYRRPEQAALQVHVHQPAEATSALEILGLVQSRISQS